MKRDSYETRYQIARGAKRGVSHDARRADIMTSTLERTRPRGDRQRARSSIGDNSRRREYVGELQARRPQKFADENGLQRFTRSASDVSVRCVSSVPNCSNFTSDPVAVRRSELRDCRPLRFDRRYLSFSGVINYDNKRVDT